MMTLNWQSAVFPLVVGLCVLPAAGLTDFLFVVLGMFGGAAVVISSCSEEPDLRNVRKCVDLTWILDPFRVFWGELKYRRTSKELLRRHKFKSYSKLPGKLQDATGKVIYLVIRDFLTSWYDQVTGDEEMAHESQKLLKQAANRAFNILKRVEAQKLVSDVIVLFQAHIGPMRKAWQQVKSNHGNTKVPCDENVEDNEACLSPVARAYAQQCCIHPAMVNSESERTYVRNTVALLLELLLPPTELNCIPGVFILKETIACNAVLSLIHYVSNPDWINLTVIDVLEEMPLEVYRKLEDCSDDDSNDGNREESEKETKRENQISIIKKEDERKDQVSTIRVVNPASLEKEAKLTPPFDDGFLMLQRGSNVIPASNRQPGKLTAIQEETRLLTKKRLKLLSPHDMPSHSLVLDSTGMPLTDNSSVPLSHRHRSESLPSVLDVNEPKVPSVRHDEPVDYASMLAVSGIESVTVGKEYKVFVIKYSDAIWFEAAAKQPIDLSNVVKRRYNEFAELDNCLRAGKNAHCIKGVELPRKRLPFPLSLTEPENKFLLTRQRHLEAYLHILLSKREIRISRELMDFLAVNTDPNVAYLKRQKAAGVLRPLLAVSEALTKAKTGIMEGFPIRLTQNTHLEVSPPRCFSPSPFEEVSWKDEAIDSQSATAVFHAYLEVRATDPDLSMSPGAPEVHLLSQVRRQSQQNEDVRDEIVGGKEDEFEDTDITDRLTALGAEALSETDSWLRGERVYTTFLALFGRLLERFVKDELHDILTEARWTRYIGMLKDSLWPGGQLRSGNESPRTDKQRAATKREALRLLKNFPPDMLRLAAGSSLYDSVMEELLEMVQDPWINRHLIYTLLDLIIESVIEHSDNEILPPEIL